VPYLSVSYDFFSRLGSPGGQHGGRNRNPRPEVRQPSESPHERACREVLERYGIYPVDNKDFCQDATGLVSNAKRLESVLDLLQTHQAAGLNQCPNLYRAAVNKSSSVAKFKLAFEALRECGVTLKEYPALYLAAINHSDKVGEDGASNLTPEDVLAGLLVHIPVAELHELAKTNPQGYHAIAKKGLIKKALTRENSQTPDSNIALQLANAFFGYATRIFQLVYDDTYDPLVDDNGSAFWIPLTSTKENDEDAPAVVPGGVLRFVLRDYLNDFGRHDPEADPTFEASKRRASAIVIQYGTSFPALDYLPLKFIANLKIKGVEDAKEIFRLKFIASLQYKILLKSTDKRSVPGVLKGDAFKELRSIFETIVSSESNGNECEKYALCLKAYYEYIDTLAETHPIFQQPFYDTNIRRSDLLGCCAEFDNGRMVVTIPDADRLRHHLKEVSGFEVKVVDSDGIASDLDYVRAFIRAEGGVVYSNGREALHDFKEHAVTLLVFDNTPNLFKHYSRTVCKLLKAWLMIIEFAQERKDFFEPSITKQDIERLELALGFITDLTSNANINSELYIHLTKQASSTDIDFFAEFIRGVPGLERIWDTRHPGVPYDADRAVFVWQHVRRSYITYVKDWVTHGFFKADNRGAGTGAGASSQGNQQSRRPWR
jgi:hypothetical protein